MTTLGEFGTALNEVLGSDEGQAEAVNMFLGGNRKEFGERELELAELIDVAKSLKTMIAPFCEEPSKRGREPSRLTSPTRHGHWLQEGIDDANRAKVKARSKLTEALQRVGVETDEV